MAGSSKKAIIAALVGNSLIAVTKFIAASITGSAAMVAEGIHSLVDTGNQGLLLYGLKQAKRPADKKFPFGHGKEIYFWSFVVAILIFALGGGISIWHGIHQVMHPTMMSDPTINYIVLGLAILFEAGAFYFAYREFNKSRGKKGIFQAVREGKDPAMFVVLFEDGAAMLGLLIALFGIMLTQFTNNPLYDGGASIAIGVVLALTAVWLAIETKSLLIGEAADPEVTEGIRQVCLGFDEVEHVNEVLTMHMGPEFILANLSLEFKDDKTADDIENAIAAMDVMIKQNHPRVKRVFVEAEARHAHGGAQGIAVV